MNKLITLPNGSWTLSTAVTSIDVQDASERAEFKWPPRVTIKYDGFFTTIDCKTIEEARAMAEKLALDVNAALTVKEDK